MKYLVIKSIDDGNRIKEGYIFFRDCDSPNPEIIENINRKLVATNILPDEIGHSHYRLIAKLLEKVESGELPQSCYIDISKQPLREYRRNKVFEIDISTDDTSKLTLVVQCVLYYEDLEKYMIKGAKL